MPASKPSKTFIAKAMPGKHGRWLAQYSAPGLFPEYVKEGDEYAVFGSEEDANAAAARVLMEMLNFRLARPEVRPDYKLMTPDEFSRALDDAGITPQFFSWASGTRPRNVQEWLMGTKPIPHHVRVIVTLLADPGTRAMIEGITDANSTTGRRT